MLERVTHVNNHSDAVPLLPPPYALRAHTFFHDDRRHLKEFQAFTTGGWRGLDEQKFDKNQKAIILQASFEGDDTHTLRGRMC